MTHQEKVDEAIKLIARCSEATEAGQYAVAAECMKQAFTLLDSAKKEIDQCE